MAPKAAKKGSAKPAADVNKNWEAGLTKAPFEEDSWKACVSLVVGTSPQDEQLIHALALAVQQPQRKLFKVLTWESTLAKIHELGNPKAKKPDDAPMYNEVTEPAKVLLDAGEAIPCDLMAKILKFQLLHIKASDQQRREAEKPSVPSGKDKGGGKGADKKGKAPPPTPPEPAKEKKTKLKRRDDVESPKFIDDEPEDGPQHYVLVLGFHQPQLIRALDAIEVHVANVIKLGSEHKPTSEVQQEQLPREADEQSQRASQVLDADAEDREAAELAAQARNLDLFWSGLRPVLDGGPPESKLNDVVELTYTVLDRHTRDPELEFGSLIFEDVASLIYDCLTWRLQHQHYLHNIRLISVPTVGDVDQQPAEVIPAPVSMTPKNSKKKSLTPPDQDKHSHTNIPRDVDMRYYNNLLDLVPPEACSVPIVLHCLLEQVVISTDQSYSCCSSEESEPHSGAGLDKQLASFMLQSFLPLLHTEEERRQLLCGLMSTLQDEEDKKNLVKTFWEEETRKKPKPLLVIRHHDERALRFRDITAVKSFDPAEVELSMMRRSLVCQLIHSGAQQRRGKPKWMAIKQQLKHYCTDEGILWPEVESLFHQSVFESMPLTRLDRKAVLLDASGPLGTPEPAQQHNQTTIPWDNPLSFAKQQLHNLRTKGPTFLTEDPGSTEQIRGRVCSQLDLSAVQSCRLRNLFDWHYTEHHDASIFPQVLQLASEEYRCLDTFRGSHNNILYIFCHNPMSPYRQSMEFWDEALHTEVKFRRYLEHVAEKISDWTKEEEAKKEAILLKKSNLLKSLQDEKPLASPEKEKEKETMEPIIRKDSLKAWKLEQDQTKEDKSKKEIAPKGKQPKEAAQPADAKKGGKKGKAEAGGNSAKQPAEAKAATAPPAEGNNELHQTEEAFNGFIGYNADGKLIHVSGRIQHLFPSDGGHITVENVYFLEGSSLMSLTVKKDGHHFCTHINHTVVDPPKPSPQPQDKEASDNKEDIKRPEEPVQAKRVNLGSLSAVLDNGIHLSYSFYGPTGEHIVSPQEKAGRVLDSIPLKTQSNTRLPESHSTVGEGSPALPSTRFNGLNLSVPNGLLLQFLQEDAQGVSSEEQGMLVRQAFPLHGRGSEGPFQHTSLSKEMSRTVTSQGAVIKHMRDGSTEVLFADGSASFSQDSGPVWVPDSEVGKGNTSEENEGKTEEPVSDEKTGAPRGCWLTTTPSGARIHTAGTTHRHIPASPILIFKATDPITHEVMLSREDLVVSVQNPDGSMTVKHADGTKITSLYQDGPPNTPQHTPQNTEKHPESVTLMSTSECECVSVTQSADSIDEETCDNGEEMSAEDAGKAVREDGAGCHEKLTECENGSDERETRFDKSEESVFAEEPVAENGTRSSCRSDKGNVSARRERVVLVEKEGYATVVMYPEQNTAQVFLADGTVITGDSRGAYQVFPSRSGLLQIQSDGKCVYSSDTLVTPSLKGDTPASWPGSYTMSHTDHVACDITDPDGNHFQVMEDGQLSVMTVSPAVPSFTHVEEDPEDEEDREMGRINVRHREHCPRLFMVHEDGSGTELLSSQTAQDILYQAYSDPSIAVLKEPLPDKHGEFGITILKPCHLSVWSQWLLGKQDLDITPPNLRNRSWHDFPRTEWKSPGPLFGTDIGRGLTLREKSVGSAARRPPVRSCPKALEMRELYKHKPFTRQLKDTLDTRLKKYMENLMEKEQRSEERRVKDPRTEEESVHASDLLNLVLSFAEEEDAVHTLHNGSSGDMSDLYSQGVEATTEQLDFTEVTAATESFPKRKDSKWAERLAQYRQEMCDKQAFRDALKKKSVVPFFHPENVPFYQHQAPDMTRLSMNLPPIPKSGSAEALLKGAPKEEAPRPAKPKASRSASHTDRSDWMHGKRPTEPTPQSAGESCFRASGQCKSLNVSVTGKPRRTKVRLPTSILSSKPCSVPNQQFLSVEEPVRRKCHTASLTNPHVIMRGFQLFPSSVDFGTLLEGTSSSITVVMKNVGVDTCRFHIKQPAPASGLRVIYNPGPVAAGLHVELQVQLFAMCAAQAGAVEPKKYIPQDIVIHTETDILYLPVTATVLPEKWYGIWLMERTSAHKKKSSKVCCPPSGQSEGGSV